MLLPVDNLQHLSKNKNRYQGVYSTEFWEKISTIDDAHKNCNAIADNANIMTKMRKNISVYKKECIDTKH